MIAARRNSQSLGTWRISKKGESEGNVDAGGNEGNESNNLHQGRTWGWPTGKSLPGHCQEATRIPSTGTEEVGAQAGKQAK